MTGHKLPARQEHHEQIDASVQVRQTLSWPVVLQMVVMLTALAGVYANMVSNDREFAANLAQVREDVRRVEREAKDLRSDIRADLTEIKAELRELRMDVTPTRRHPR